MLSPNDVEVDPDRPVGGHPREDQHTSSRRRHHVPAVHRSASDAGPPLPSRSTTTWAQAGLPLGEVARRLGDRVETRVEVYGDAPERDVQLTNDGINALFGDGPGLQNATHP